MADISKNTFVIKGLLVSGVPTINSNVYTDDCLLSVMNQIINSQVKVTVQEMNVPERERDGIPAYEPIKSRTMAIILGATVINGSLDVVCETRSTRDGKKLTGMLNTIGIELLEFVPVGFGKTRINGKLNEVYDYILKYVSVDPIT